MFLPPGDAAAAVDHIQILAESGFDEARDQLQQRGASGAMQMVAAGSSQLGDIQNRVNTMGAKATTLANDKLQSLERLITHELKGFQSLGNMERLAALQRLWDTLLEMIEDLPTGDVGLEKINPVVASVVLYGQLLIGLFENRLEECERALDFVAAQLHDRLTGAHLAQPLKLCMRDIYGAGPLLSMLGLPRVDDLNASKMKGILKRSAMSRMPVGRKLSKLHTGLLSSMSQAKSNEQFVRSFDFDHSGTLDGDDLPN
eukprot:TRINITY_DN8206_c0_g1_i1.p2 TRINITY_DN8206_c0_g1~~TRINITY_DN8206_c0_g1_i1.p2  ORF type:complete len:258 (+),score=56.73 TRINITY_DN8206_c0_g1_i1:1111-1884(+)